MPLEELTQTCQVIFSPPHGSKCAGMVGMLVVYDRVATAAIGCKEKVAFGRGGAWCTRGSDKTLRFSGMGLGHSPCTLLVFPWLGEVVGASLAMG